MACARITCGASRSPSWRTQLDTCGQWRMERRRRLRLLWTGEDRVSARLGYADQFLHLRLSATTPRASDGPFSPPRIPPASLPLPSCARGSSAHSSCLLPPASHRITALPFPHAASPRPTSSPYLGSPPTISAWRGGRRCCRGVFNALPVARSTLGGVVEGRSARALRVVLRATLRDLCAGVMLSSFSGVEVEFGGECGRATGGTPRNRRRRGREEPRVRSRHGRLACCRTRGAAVPVRPQEQYRDQIRRDAPQPGVEETTKRGNTWGGGSCRARRRLRNCTTSIKVA
ncbi:hypothetical protein K438DRAFT_569790 [Mycena galopus ATCC 62051]|nr:hypothetical protein K438DRAFT_569790 [Mycena galopus ATCC 62051]